LLRVLAITDAARERTAKQIALAQDTDDLLVVV
jgi:hypothetical protein